MLTCGLRRWVSGIIIEAIVGAMLIASSTGTLRAAAPFQTRAARIAQPARVVVPSVRGLTADSASRVVARAGLRSVRVPRRVAGVVAGIVIDQSPAGGRIVRRGDLDTIFVATAIPLDTPVTRGGVVSPARRTRVPSLARLLQREADSALRARRLVLGSVGARQSESPADGRVIAQSIPADSVVLVGTPIDVTIGRYTPPQQPAIVPAPGAPARGGRTVDIGTSPGVVVVTPVKARDWTWILVVVGLAGVGGGIVFAIKHLSNATSEPPKPPEPHPRSTASGITTGVSGDPPVVSVHSESNELRGPEIELHTASAAGECHLVLHGPSLILDETVHAQR
jgi:hypothetical protein